MSIEYNCLISLYLNLPPNSVSSRGSLNSHIKYRDHGLEYYFPGIVGDMDKWATNRLQSVSCLKVGILVWKFNEILFIKDWASDIRTFRQKMYMDSPMETLTKNDGIISLMHCQEWNFVQDTFRLEFKNSCCHCRP